MAFPFKKSPKLRDYLEWARNSKCEVHESHYGTELRIRITSPDNKTIHFIGFSLTETLSHSVIANADRRLGIDSPFPKTPPAA